MSSKSTNSNLSVNKLLPERKTITVPEAAAYLGVSKQLIYNMIRNGNAPFKFLPVNKKILISKRSFNEYLEASGV